MSESTYIEVVTKTQYSAPEVEVQYLFNSFWDVVVVQQLTSINDENFEWETCTFEVIIFELSPEESASILEDVKKMALDVGCKLAYKIKGV